MSKVIVVTSGKGGRGQNHLDRLDRRGAGADGRQRSASSISTSACAISTSCMGAERRVVYDFINVAQGDAKLAQALIRDKRVETLHLLAASQTRDKDALTDEGVERVIGELRESFDWVLCDSPAGIERGALAGDALRRRGDRGHQPGNLVGARLRPHHRPARLQDPPRRGAASGWRSTCC